MSSEQHTRMKETHILNLPNVISSRRNTHGKCITFTIDVSTMQNVGLTLPVQSQLSRFYVTKSDMTMPHKDCFSLVTNTFEDAKISALATIGASHFNFKVNTNTSLFPFFGQLKFVTVTVTLN